jgi:hypothetical protein
VEIPAWKQRLIEKKRLKAAAEGQDGAEGSGSEMAQGQGDGSAQQGVLKKSTSSADADSECHLMEGFLFKRDGGKRHVHRLPRSQSRILTSQRVNCVVTERWIRKWFVLSGPYLVCYGDKRTEKNQLAPQGILSLELATAVRAPRLFFSSTSLTSCGWRRVQVVASPDKANGIEITDQTDGKYQVYACTKGEYELWLDSITVPIALSLTAPSSAPCAVCATSDSALRLLVQAAQAKYSHRYMNRPVSGSGSARWFNIASAVSVPLISPLVDGRAEHD